MVRRPAPSPVVDVRGAVSSGRRRARTLAAIVAGCAVAAAALCGALASCVSAESYVYTAQRYDPNAKCLESYTAIEVVNGSNAYSACAPTCLRVGGDIFVSTMCPPLPSIATEVPSDESACGAALAAHNQSFSCNSAREPVDSAAPEAGGDAHDAEPPSEGGDPDASDASDAGGDAKPG